MSNIILGTTTVVGSWIFDLNAQTLIDTGITLVAMLFLFILLSYLLFNPARDLMKKRQDKIQSEMDTAANEKADAIAYKAEYDEKLSKVDDEANEILNTARKKALKKESEIVQDAKDEAVRIMNRAKKEAELEKNKVKDQVKQEMIDIAITAAGKMVSVSIDENKQAELISDTLKEMGEETWQS